jgi:hypothetical protein
MVGKILIYLANKIPQSNLICKFLPCLLFSYHMYLTQMVNTRRGGGIDLPPNRHTRWIYRQPQPQPAEMNPPNPPPGGVDPLVAAQMRMMQQMADTMADMRAQMQQERQEMRQEREEIRQELHQERQEIHQERRAQQQQQQQQQVPLPPPPPPPPVPPRDKHREFMSHKPPTFASSPDPLDADDWLKSVEKMLNIAQCTDREKVLYASGRLTGPAADWWDSYTAAHDAADTITWAEFSTQFRNYHIPAGLMKIKKKKFLSLKQGSMSVVSIATSLFSYLDMPLMKLLKMRGSRSILLKDLMDPCSML